MLITLIVQRIYRDCLYLPPIIARACKQGGNETTGKTGWNITDVTLLKREVWRG
ncbi:hypothetical protein Barb4_04045 [Bacteroidales bacterium Barb4]|nr:hypothetical protein Barb4_04045 [Bacteroidales bacterium Barb4]